MTRQKIEALKEFDAADYLETPEDVAAYLDAAFEDADPARIADALGVVARSRGMTATAAEIGITREGLHKALSGKGDPKLSTLIKLFSALGVRMSAAPVVPAE